MQPMIDAIAKITIYVDDQDEAEKFWTEKIGLTVTERQPMGPGMTWLEVAPEKGKTSFVLYSRKAMEGQDSGASVGHPSVILTTRDIYGAFTFLKEHEVNMDELLELPYGKMLTFYDQEGNRYLLREEK